MGRYIAYTILILFFIFISNIWITTLYLDATYKFNRELKRNRILKKENEYLKTQVKTLLSPEHIIKIAKKKLHLKFARNSQVIEIDE